MQVKFILSPVKAFFFEFSTKHFRTEHRKVKKKNMKIPPPNFVFIKGKLILLENVIMSTDPIIFLAIALNKIAIDVCVKH